MLTQTKLDHAVDAVGVDLGLLEGESRSQEGSFEEQQDEILDRLVVLVCVSLLS